MHSSGNIQIAWDCRSFAPHMGGVAHAVVGWLTAFLAKRPRNWGVVTLHSAACDEGTLNRLVPQLRNGDLGVSAQRVECGFVAPRFEQLALPVLLERMKIDLYFNPAFTLPAIKTTRWQATAVHDVVFLDHPEWVSPQLRRVFGAATDLAMKRADVVFTVSQFTRGRLHSYASCHDWRNVDCLKLIRPAVSEEHKLAAKGYLAGVHSPASWPSDYLLYLGSVEEKKGATILLDGYRQLRARMGQQTPKLVIAGGEGGQPYDLDRKVRARELSPHVVQLGAVSHEEKRSLMAGAKVFVFPSLYEGFGIPPLEAMCFGTPVVAARSSALPEVLGDAAEYAEPADPGSLASAIHRVLTDDALRARLAKAGPAQVDKFQWTDAANTLIETFSELMRVGA